MGNLQKWCAVLGLTIACCISAGPIALAKPFSAELRFDIKKGEPGLPNDYTKLEFGDGSDRYVALVRRTGRVMGSGMFRGAMVQEWGFHEVTLGPEPNGEGSAISSSRATRETWCISGHSCGNYPSQLKPESCALSSMACGKFVVRPEYLKVCRVLARSESTNYLNTSVNGSWTVRCLGPNWGGLNHRFANEAPIVG